MGGYWYLLCLF